MAVYTQLSNETIAGVLEQDYGLKPLAFVVGIAQGVENSNYLVAIGKEPENERKFILTLYEKRVKVDELPFFLRLMQHVAQHGLACPQPIARKDGKLFGQVQGRQAALVSFLEGKSRSILQEVHCAAVGETNAMLHIAAQDYNDSRPNALSLEGWKTLAKKLKGRLDSVQPGLDKLVADEIVYLEKHWPHDLPRGIIHADLFPDNVFFVDDAVSGVIDFYFACEDFLAYDVAVTLNSWCFEPDHSFNPGKAKLLLKNYQAKRAFTAEEKKAFPVLLRGAALRFLLTRAHDLIHHEAGALVNPKDPLEYAMKLQFHRSGAWIVDRDT